MRQEWKKLAATWITPLLAAVFIILNSVLFYYICHELRPVKEQWTESYDVLQEEKEHLQQEIEEGWTAFDVDVEAMHEKEERADAVDALLERKQYIDGYHDWLTGYIQEMHMKLDMDMFTAKQEREIQHGIGLYEKLEDLPEKDGFYGVEEKILKSKLPLLFALVMMITSCMILFQQDKRDRMDVLMRTLPGWRTTAWHKTQAVFLSAWLLFIVLLMLEGMIGSMVLGPVDLTAPVQYVYGFHTCPYPLTIGMYFLLCFMWESFALAGVCACLSACMQHLDLFRCIVMGGIVGILSIFMASSTTLWVDTLSPLTILDGSTLFSHDFMLFVGPIMIPQIIPMLTVIGIVMILSWYGLHKNRKMAKTKKKRRRRQFRFPKTLSGIEDVKLAWHSGGLWIIIALILLIPLYCRTYHALLSPAEYLYRQYSMVLEGRPSADKEAYLAKEEVALQKDPEEQFKMEVLRRAKGQYAMVAEDGQYVYETGYTAYFLGDVKGYRKNCLLIGALAALCIFAWNSGMEQETGTVVLAETYGAKHRIKKVKFRNALVTACLLAVCTTLPMLLRVHEIYGFGTLTASAASISAFELIPKHLPLWGLLLLPALFAVLVYILIWKVCEEAAAKTKKTMYTMAIAGIVLVILLICM